MYGRKGQVEEAQCWEPGAAEQRLGREADPTGSC